MPQNRVDKNGNPYPNPSMPNYESHPDGTFTWHADPMWQRYQGPKPDNSPIPPPPLPPSPRGFRAPDGMGFPNTFSPTEAPTDFPDLTDQDPPIPFESGNLNSGGDSTPPAKGGRFELYGPAAGFNAGDRDRVLAGLKAAQPTQTPDLELAGYQDTRKHEYERNLEQDAKANAEADRFQKLHGYANPYSSGTGTLPSDLRNETEDWMRNPMIPASEKADISELQKMFTRGITVPAEAQMNAGLAGFKGPQEAAAWQRGQEELKNKSPQEVARINSEGNLAQQREVSAGNLAVAKENLSGIQGAYSNLLGMFANGRIPAGAHLTLPKGYGSITTPSAGAKPHVPSNIEIQLAKARQEASGIFGNSGADAKINSLVTSALTEHPASSELKQFAAQIVKNPKYAEAPFDQIIPKLVNADGSPMNGQEIEDLRSLIGIMRGF